MCQSDLSDYVTGTSELRCWEGREARQLTARSGLIARLPAVREQADRGRRGSGTSMKYGLEDRDPDMPAEICTFPGDELHDVRQFDAIT